MMSDVLAIVSFLLIVNSVIALRYIVKCSHQRKAISYAYYYLLGIDGMLQHDSEKITEVRMMLLEELD